MSRAHSRKILASLLPSPTLHQHLGGMGGKEESDGWEGRREEMMGGKRRKWLERNRVEQIYTWEGRGSRGKLVGRKWRLGSEGECRGS